MITFSELLKQRRSIRDFQDRQVSLELIQEILQDCCLAPSSGNGQPWRFIIIQDKTLIKKISDDSKAGLIAKIEKDPQLPAKKYEDNLRKEDFNVFYNAPCLVIFVGPKLLGSLQVDCAMAAAYFMLSAAARGLGTCWIGLGGHFTSSDLCSQIGLSDEYQIVAPIIVGYPKQIPVVPARNEPHILKVIPG